MSVCIYVTPAVSVREHSIVFRLQSDPRRRMQAIHDGFNAENQLHSVVLAIIVFNKRISCSLPPFVLVLILVFKFDSFRSLHFVHF